MSGSRDSARSVDICVAGYPSRGQIAAILVEPVPLRAGLCVFPNTAAYLRGLREIADEHEALLLFDEIQTFGWVDELLAANHFGASPDIISLAKGVAFGFPLAAVLMRTELQSVLEYNEAELTPGGHVLSCAVAAEGLRILFNEDFAIEEKGAFLESCVHQVVGPLRDGCGRATIRPDTGDHIST